MINKIRNNKKDLFCIGILMLIYLFIILAITRFKFAYGSSMDWDNQHYAFPEYFRNLFYETKNFFPSFAPQIGSGQNIYNFSYYGMFNPLILPSYLMPFVSMSAYIQAISIISVAVSVIMFYAWIRKRYDLKIAFLSSCLFLFAAPIIFHSHRHIMFVSYLPFFMGALFCCDKFFENKNRAGIIFCMSMIMFTSYYFSIGSYMAIFVYITALFLNKNSVFKIKEYIKSIVNLGICMFISVMISAVLWLPTIYAISQGRANTNVKITLKDILIPTIDYKAVVYSPYSMGLMIISLMAVIFAVIRKNSGRRFIGAVLSAFVIFKLFSFVMNGFMYGEEKALIPFIPLALLLTAEFAKAVLNSDISNKFWIFLNIGLTLGGIVFVLISKEYVYSVSLILDLIGVNTAYFIYKKRGNQIAFISIVSIVAFAFCLRINLYDSLCERKNIVKVDKTFRSEIQSTEFSNDDDNLYRVSQLASEGKTMNKVYGKDYYTTTVYSSLQNQNYNNFYYNVFQNEMVHRNSATVSETLNPFFYSYMGKKYLFIENTKLNDTILTVPYGYKEIKKEDDITLYKNDNVKPLGYASDNIMSSSQFKSLDYPYNMKALMDYTVVDEDSADVSIEGIKEIDSSFADELFSNLPENITFDKDTNTVYADTNKPLKNKYLRTSSGRRKHDADRCTVNLKNPINDCFIITCKADNNIGKGSSDIYLLINGIKNKLTDPSWKYYNNNKKFCYVLSSNEPITSIELLFSNGKYKLSDWKFYTVKKSELEGLANKVDEFKINKEKTKGDIFEGTINVSKDNSYFKMTVPYADGFTAYVDGEKTDIKMVDNAFIGFRISKGSHDIKIIYTAPFLKEAKAISLAGILVLLIVLSIQIAVRMRSKKSIGVKL